MAAFRRQGGRRAKIGRVATAARLCRSVYVPQRLVARLMGRRTSLGGDAGSTSARRDLHVAAGLDPSQTLGGILDGSCLGLEVSRQHSAATTVLGMMRRRFEAAQAAIVSPSRRQRDSREDTKRARRSGRHCGLAKGCGGSCTRGARVAQPHERGEQRRLPADRCRSPRLTALRALLPMSSSSITDLPHRAH